MVHLSEKVELLNLIRKEKKLYNEIAKTCERQEGKTASL